MPIYEYRCSSCGHQQEFLQKVSDPQLTTCTKCGKPDFSKMLTAAGFQLKGSGWYATDFKSKGTAPKASEAKPADAQAAAKPDGGAGAGASDGGKATPGGSTTGGSGVTTTGS